MSSSSTLDYRSKSRSTSDPTEHNRLALMIAWAPEEPDRVGEIALFEPDGGARVLGRGAPPGSAGERVLFHRQRPGLPVRSAPIESRGVSREQLRVRPEGGRLLVERIGKCPLEVGGRRLARALVAPGETLLLVGQLVLLCTERPRALPALRSGSVPASHRFGEPDAHGILGESPAIWALRDALAWTARADEHTLLLGPSGAGKELAARAMHAQSSRAGGPFIARNAATIPESLIDAELFGNVKGYPNPGMPERPGLIGAADGGTLFLDELGELPERLQANLLRVLDEGGEYHPLGASTPRRSRFRLLGATNRGPSSLKHDLAARLVLEVTIPGLDERHDDIPFLARHLLRRAGQKSPETAGRFLASTGDKEPKEPRIEASLIEHLLARRYPTNMRELDAVLWKAMASSRGDAVGWIGEGDRARPAPGGEPSVELPEPTAREIRAALSLYQGDAALSAQALGLTGPDALARLMEKHGVKG